MDKIPGDVVGRYVFDPKSLSLARSSTMFPVLVEMIRALMDKQFGKMFPNLVLRDKGFV